MIETICSHQSSDIVPWFLIVARGGATVPVYPAAGMQGGPDAGKRGGAAAGAGLAVVAPAAVAPAWLDPPVVDPPSSLRWSGRPPSRAILADAAPGPLAP